MFNDLFRRQAKDAWMEFFAEGLLLLPTHTWRFINEENRVFDVRRSPCCVGILPELFRHRPGVVRSLHSTHSMAAYGKGAAAYLEGELDANTPCTPGGCYDRLRAAHGKVLLLGVTLIELSRVLSFCILLCLYQSEYFDNNVLYFCLKRESSDT